MNDLMSSSQVSLWIDALFAVCKLLHSFVKYVAMQII